MNATAEMRDFHARYIDAFNRSDHPSIVSFFSFPWIMVIGAAQPHVVSSEQAQLHNLQHVAVQIKAQGWVRSTVDRLEVYSTGPDSGLVASVFSRYRDDGSIIETKHAYYVLRRMSSDWKITSIFEMPVPDGFPRSSGD